MRELEDRITILESELSVLRTKLSITESSQALSRTFFNLTDEEKAALVDNCEIRTDLPRPMSETIALDLSLSKQESAAWDRAWTRYDAARQAEMVELWEQLTGDRLQRIELLAIPPQQLQGIRAQADPGLLRVLAEERAGMRSPPSEAEYTALPPADRWVRLNVLQGDAFQRYLADELGPSRARELRSATDGWPGGRMHREGCPGEGE